MRNVREKTIPVNAIMPEATAEYRALAAFTLMVETRPGRTALATRGMTVPQTSAPAAYASGIAQIATSFLLRPPVALIGWRYEFPLVVLGVATLTIMGAIRSSA